MKTVIFIPTGKKRIKKGDWFYDKGLNGKFPKYRTYAGLEEPSPFDIESYELAEIEDADYTEALRILTDKLEDTEKQLENYAEYEEKDLGIQEIDSLQDAKYDTYAERKSIRSAISLLQKLSGGGK